MTEVYCDKMNEARITRFLGLKFQCGKCVCENRRDNIVTAEPVPAVSSSVLEPDSFVIDI